MKDITKIFEAVGFLISLGFFVCFGNHGFISIIEDRQAGTYETPGSSIFSSNSQSLWKGILKSRKTR